MSIYFDTDEIFEIAVRIEENGERFYRRAATILSDPDVCNLLTDLADAEVQHKKTFSALRDRQKAHGDKIAVDPVEENEAYLKAWADGHIFTMQDDPLDLLTGEEPVEEILNMAITAEKDSVVFYLGMKDAVYGDDDKNIVERIIREEMGHYASLSWQLNKFLGKVN